MKETKRKSEAESERVKQAAQSNGPRQRENKSHEEIPGQQETKWVQNSIQADADHLTTPFPQQTADMARSLLEAWDAYEERWRQLIHRRETGEKSVLTFATVPWPLLNPPSGPDEIIRRVVRGFILSQWHSQDKLPRKRIREALLRWHPDRFASRWLGWVPEGEERENVRLGVATLAYRLNDLLTEYRVLNP